MPDKRPAASVPQTPFPVHLLIYGVLATLLMLVLVCRYFRPLVLGDSIDVEPALVQQVEQRIDPNLVSWAELARLPAVGESLAKRIVAYRDERATQAGRPVFTRAEDLLAVSGIGPKTLEGIRPHLKFPER